MKKLYPRFFNNQKVFKSMFYGFKNSTIYKVPALTNKEWGYAYNNVILVISLLCTNNNPRTLLVNRTGTAYLKT